ncbi:MULTISPECIES: DUF808 family protein [Brenneria]|uniref:DUF808 domain-containing protein n=1 Tax=Brenneria nigrifluens DSM 30175 = ATCC 13028 TaxID=1121120 RepID=A0A2U1UQE8_9GAMM|nr:MULTISPECIES: DUF808 family protein [Brenneria]EHD20700.1 protein of unknown function DUF808 [Brenneria sp. EniD312]PWC23792.1 DUF808 domain-containing protein [Brenneria nigrifluens DSM 30175 = ATCC 13028]QCR03877.1 DUF808 family protein [Brenneria nigrifluens] [Brenneria nigrifluens DSM 30175 = ATCC 13028]
MAGASLLTLLDDIATLLDDIAVMGKMAVKKTAGVLGDDLSLNAQQVSGVKANRELPVVWRVAKGSFLNKLFLVPVALLISAFIPWAITPLLMIGGAFLCYEGVEKVMHSLHRDKAEKTPEARQQRLLAAAQSADTAGYEDDKVKGAIRTDFILSAEIVAITLGIVSESPLLNQVLVLSGIAMLVTVGVYGIVAGIVKLDDLGLWLEQRASFVAQKVGGALLVAAPWLMKILSVVGTLAMFLVGGGIVVHGWPLLHHAVTDLGEKFGGFGAVLTNNLANLIIGFIVGAVVLFAVTVISRLRGKK